MACCVELEGCSLRATLDFLHPPLVLVGDDFENRVREEWGTQVVSTNTQLGDLGQQPASLSGSFLVNSYGEHPWNSNKAPAGEGGSIFITSIFRLRNRSMALAGSPVG